MLGQGEMRRGVDGGEIGVVANEVPLVMFDGRWALTSNVCDLVKRVKNG